MTEDTPIFRFDDVSINTNEEKFGALLYQITVCLPNVTFLLAISPIVFTPLEQLPEGQEQRVHPTHFTALSSLTPYYGGFGCGIPSIRKRYAKMHIVFAGHGLAHVDHRLLDYQAQEMSILMSCHLAQANVFVPPYNKWDHNTVSICSAQGIRLIKFEDGYKHVGYNKFDPQHKLWYMHPFDFTAKTIKEWFER